jgi:hypothetical protein
MLNKRTKKVIAMEIESTNHQDVAEPDLIASGMAGTGHEYQNRNGTTGKQEKNNSLRSGKTKREIIGLGVLYNGMTNPAIIPDNTNSPGTDSCSDRSESAGDLIFYLYERQERIADRLNKKIERLDRRLTTIEERGRRE